MGCSSDYERNINTLSLKEINLYKKKLSILKQKRNKIYLFIIKETLLKNNENVKDLTDILNITNKEINNVKLILKKV